LNEGLLTYSELKSLLEQDKVHFTAEMDIKYNDLTIGAYILAEPNYVWKVEGDIEIVITRPDPI
jgi:hypothetical protein